MTTVKYLCHHCHAEWHGKDTDNRPYCKDCNTAEKRKEMDEANKKLFIERGLVYVPPESYKPAI